ncbi:hypothetical protein CDAR_274461 [Caerostris darwini]|uniref:Uncharacterized protein n=1 Tax=Caerostris darwini TaxID=1538125 RepID=A0AAV4RF81_9ARAC|nr:hypothetical protein CDAR_274461 [Caerostris darwini]
MRRPKGVSSAVSKTTEAGTEAVRRATGRNAGASPLAEQQEPAITAVKLIMMCFSALPLFAYDGSPLMVLLRLASSARRSSSQKCLKDLQWETKEHGCPLPPSFYDDLFVCLFFKKQTGQSEQETTCFRMS